MPWRSEDEGGGHPSTRGLLISQEPDGNQPPAATVSAKSLDVQLNRESDENGTEKELLEAFSRRK